MTSAAANPRVLPVISCVICLCFTSAAGADDKKLEEFASLFPTGRHLAEFSVTSIDTAEGDQLIWLPGYTLAYSTSLRFSGSVGVVESDLVGGNDSGSSSGLTDSQLLVQYDPSAQLTANAFLPDTVGLTFGLRVPTADHDKGLGVDLWAASLGAGWLVDFPWSFWLLPSLQYEFSFDEAPGVQRIERADLGLGLYWLFSFKGWLGIEPVIAHDLVEQDSAFDWSVVLGKAWSTGWAVDLRWSRLDRLDSAAVRDDEVLFFGISYQFGQPPLDFIP